MTSQKLLGGLILALACLGLNQTARAESMLQGFLNVFLHADNTQQTAQVDQSALNSLRADGGVGGTNNTASTGSNDNYDYSAGNNTGTTVDTNPSASLSDAMAKAQKLQKDAEANLLKAKQFKSTDITALAAKVKTGAVARAQVKSVQTAAGLASTAGCSSGEISGSGNEGDTLVCQGGQWVANQLFRMTSPSSMSVGSIWSGAALSAWGNFQNPHGLWGQGSSEGGVGVIGFGSNGSDGVYGYSDRGTGVEGQGTVYGLMGNKYTPLPLPPVPGQPAPSPIWGAGVRGSATVGSGVQGTGWDWHDSSGGLWAATGVYGQAESGNGVEGYSQNGTGVMAGGRWTGLYAYANADNGTGVGIWSPNGGWGVYQYNSNSKNRFAGKVETEKDFCIVNNGPEKCLSQMGAGSGGGGLANVSGGDNVLVRFDRGSAYSFYAGIPNPTDSVWQVQDNFHQPLLQLNYDGKTKLTNLRGDGNAFVCVDSSGTLYRSLTACR